MINNVFAADAAYAMAPTSAVPGYQSALGTTVAGPRRRPRLNGTTLGTAPRT